MSECAYYDRGECGSCDLLRISAENRASFKEKALSDLVAREWGLAIPTRPLWQPSSPWHSRTKAKLNVSRTASNPLIGLAGTPTSEFRGQELLDCPLHVAPINEVLHTIKELVARFDLTPYDIAKRQGELKGLIIKTSAEGTAHATSHAEGGGGSFEMLVRFVLRSRGILDRVRKAADELRTRHPFVTVVSANLQPIPHAILEGEVEIVLTERTHLWERFEMGPAKGFSLAFAPQSFSQVTHSTAQALYAHVGSVVARLAREKGAPLDGMLDLYCGVGGFSFAAHAGAGSSAGVSSGAGPNAGTSSGAGVAWSHGVEISAQAIECAGLAREKNGMGQYHVSPEASAAASDAASDAGTTLKHTVSAPSPRMRFTAGDVEVFLREYGATLVADSGAAPNTPAATGNGSPQPPELILVNPPRRGLSPSIIESITRLRPRHVIYSSCNPETLMRDLLALRETYDVVELAPFDMFPLTSHLEVVAQLKLR